jgi:hypothetical protein
MRESTRLSVLLRAWRGGRKVCAIVAVLVMAVAGSAFGKIGETQGQVIARCNRDRDILKVEAGQWIGKRTLEVYARNGKIVTHVFGQAGREVALLLYAPMGLNNAGVVDVQREYGGTWRGTGTDGGLFSWANDRSALGMAAQRVEGSDYLWIFDLSQKTEMAQLYAALNQQKTPTRPNTGIFDDIPQAPAAKSAQPDEPDCLIIASEKNAKLQKAGVWSRIARYNEATLAPSGHAAVFYQPTPDSAVCIYDKNFGSLELPTRSHELGDIIAAFNQVLGGGYKFQYTRWIGGEAESEIRKAKTVIEWSGLPDGAQNLTRVYVKKYGVSALLPTDVFPDAKKLSSNDESFLQGKSWTGQTTLTFSSVREPLAKVYAECATEHSPQAPSKTVHYKVLKPTWFVVSGDLGPEADSSLGFYTKGVKQDKSVVIMHFQYKEDDFPFSEETFTAMSRGFDGH